MSLPASPAWSDGDIKLSPDGTGAKRIQRIFPSPSSYREKECRMCDPDEALVLQSQSGDPAAFAELIQKHQRMIHSLTYRMTGSLADAEDLAQETFINAYRQLDSYRGAAKFSTWLYRIAINACLTWRRRETRRVQMAAEWAETNHPPQAAGSNLESGNGWSERTQEALLKLPAKQRAAVMLTLYDGLNHAEAAEVLSCSETTISWRVFAARRKLKRWLTAGGERE
ncbi:MAG: RNA polymerase sigma factor [Limisphaerales bacterium]